MATVIKTATFVVGIAAVVIWLALVLAMSVLAMNVYRVNACEPCICMSYCGPTVEDRATHIMKGHGDPANMIMRNGLIPAASDQPKGDEMKTATPMQPVKPNRNLLRDMLVTDSKEARQ